MLLRLIRRILSKLSMISVIIGIIVLLAIAWQQRGYVYDVPFEHQISYEIRVDDFAKAAEGYMTNAGAQAIILWELKVNRNTRLARYFQITGKPHLKELENDPTQIFTNAASSNALMAKLFNGETVCSNTINANPIGRALSNASIIHLCRAPIITTNNILVGYLTYGFTRNPSEEEQRHIIKQMKTVTEHLAKKAVVQL